MVVYYSMLMLHSTVPIAGAHSVKVQILLITPRSVLVMHILIILMLKFTQCAFSHYHSHTEHFHLAILTIGIFPYISNLYILEMIFYLIAMLGHVLKGS